MQEVYLYSVGTAVPENKLEQTEILEMMEERYQLDRKDRFALRQVYHYSGIDYRHSVMTDIRDKGSNFDQLAKANGDGSTIDKRMGLFEDHALALARQATDNCQAQLPDFDKNAITHLVSFSCTGMYAPGLDIQLVNQLELDSSVERTCINFMGCYAAFNALKSAYHIVRSHPNAVVLLSGVELCSLHFQNSTVLQQMVANALFSDGAASVIVAGEDAAMQTQQQPLRISDFHADLKDAGKDEMVWRIGEHGFNLTLSPYVSDLVEDGIGALVQRLLSTKNINKEDIDSFAIHPGGKKILEATERALDLSPDDNALSYEVLRNYGNMSSVTVLFILEKLMNQSADAGKQILSSAFGPGLTMEAMLFETS